MPARVAPRMFVTPFTVSAGLAGSVNVVLDDLWLKTVRIIIPDGHAGLTALQIQQGGVPVFPYGPDPYIRGNDEIVDFEWDNEITANGLSLAGFNTDIFDHSWIIRWTVTDLPAKGSPVVIASPQATPAAAADIAAVTGLSGAAVAPDSQLAGGLDLSGGQLLAGAGAL